MTYRVTILRRAWQDVQAIETYIAARSKQGAKSWVKGFDNAIASLKKNPLQEPLAPENDEFAEEIRNIMFRTRKGRTYRAIFLVRGDEVRVLRIQGAGQDTLSADNIET
jgi:plasmid stabilization system protein ParE